MSLSFQSRIMLFFSSLFISVQVLTLLAIYWVCRDNIIQQISQNLIYAENIFNRQLTEYGARMAGEARILVADFGFRSAVSDSDQETVVSALENLSYRIHAARGFYINLQGKIIADTAGRYQDQAFLFPHAIMSADVQGQSVLFGMLDGELCEIVTVPVLAPIPIGWVSIAMPIDHGLVNTFKHLSALPPDITLLERSRDTLQILTSSLENPAPAFFTDEYFRLPISVFQSPRLVETADANLLVLIRPLAAASEEKEISAVLQIDLAQAMRPYALLAYAILGLSILALAAILLGGYLLARNISKPIRALVGASQRLKDGFVDAPLPVIHDDELGRLAETFNLASRMAAEMNDLKEQDIQRRELVASVSHDLRTPLTSLHGYLETMQMHTGQVPDTERERYLAVAVRQSEKVGRLAQELFELAKLECQATPLQIETFNLMELVQDVMQKYEMAANKRGLVLQAKLDIRLPLISADIALIERVLTNLIDNALRHTPAGGFVRIACLPSAERVRVEIIDSGFGIAPEFLPKLFTRESPLSRQARVNGGGLGLLIVAKIIALHGSEIQVQSKLGQGAEFSFDLAVAT